FPVVQHCAERARRLGRVRDVAVTADVRPDLVAPVVADDVERALENLLANAIQHAPDRSTVEITATEVTSGREPHVDIIVRDHGPGFPSSFLPHAFQRFRRADTGRASTAGGTGLGLAIVQAVAEE